MLDITTREHGAAKPSNSPYPVFTAEQMAAYREQGWLLARSFVAPPEVEALARWTDELVARPEEPGKHMVYREQSLADPGRRVIQRIENFCPYHPAFDVLVRGGRLQAAVEQLLGGSACLFKEKINFKMPGGSGFEAHQDQQAGWTVYAPLFVTVLVSIDPATLENGCLEMADAPRFAGLIGDEWRPLTAEQMASFALLPVPTEPGDALFFDSYVPHASNRLRKFGSLRRWGVIRCSCDYGGDGGCAGRTSRPGRCSAI